jgi:hypothetical protein
MAPVIFNPLSAGLYKKYTNPWPQVDMIASIQDKISQQEVGNG